MITTPSSNRPIRPPPSPTPRTVPRPSDKDPSSSSTYAALPRHHRTWHSSGGARGWDTGFAGQQAGDDGDHLRTLRAPTVPRPAVPHRMLGVQRYPALFVAAPGPFLGGHGPGVQGYQVGRSGVGSRVLKGGRTVSVVPRNPRSETSALASEPFGGDRAFERPVARCWCRYGR